MFQQGSMPKKFWSEIVRVAATSLCPNFEDKTLVDIWSGKKPNVDNLRDLGSIGYSHVPCQIRDTFDEKAEKCLMIGYASTGYKILGYDNSKDENCKGCCIQ